jgi:hypothetical protein
VGFRVFLLLGKTSLDFLLIQQIGAVLETQGQLFFEISSVFLKLLSVAVLQLSQSLRIFPLSLQQVLVPLLVKVLVLLNMSLLALLPLLSLLENKLFILPLVIL